MLPTFIKPSYVLPILFILRKYLHYRYKYNYNNPTSLEYLRVPSLLAKHMFLLYVIPARKISCLGMKYNYNNPSYCNSYRHTYTRAFSICGDLVFSVYGISVKQISSLDMKYISNTSISPLTLPYIYPPWNDFLLSIRSFSAGNIYWYIYRQ